MDLSAELKTLLANPASETIGLKNLNSLVLLSLTSRLMSGDATSADISNAIKYLKDNGITSIMNEDKSEFDDLIEGILEEDLPDFERLPMPNIKDLMNE